MSLFQQFFKVFSLHLEARIQICIKVKGRIRRWIRIKVTSRIRSATLHSSVQLNQSRKISENRRNMNYVPYALSDVINQKIFVAFPFQPTQNIYNEKFPKNTTLLLPDMVVLEMVHEVSAVSFHLLIARYSAEHNLGETFTEKTLKAGFRIRVVRTRKTNNGR